MPLRRKLPCQFGHYELREEHDAGGMGTVYTAWDLKLARCVALKIPHLDGKQREKTAERFFREARIAAGIDHPNICPLYEAGEVDGEPYLTMPFLQGQTLHRVLQHKGPFALREAAELVRTLALALQVVHERGATHRDLKPSNIMLVEGRGPVVMDFGLALFEGGARLTSTGRVMGTVGYLAPEQLAEDAGAIGPHSDIYSLGVILYEILTGKLPLDGSHTDVVLYKTLHTPAPPPSAHRPDLDKALEDICLRALAKERGDRHPSMAAFAAAIQGYLHMEVKAREDEQRRLHEGDIKRLRQAKAEAEAALRQAKAYADEARQRAETRADDDLLRIAVLEEGNQSETARRQQAEADALEARWKLAECEQECQIAKDAAARVRQRLVRVKQRLAYEEDRRKEAEESLAREQAEQKLDDALNDTSEEQEVAAENGVAVPSPGNSARAADAPQVSATGPGKQTAALTMMGPPVPGFAVRCLCRTMVKISDPSENPITCPNCLRAFHHDLTWSIRLGEDSDTDDVTTRNEPEQRPIPSRKWPQLLVELVWAPTIPCVLVLLFYLVVVIGTDWHMLDADTLKALGATESAVRRILVDLAGGVLLLVCSWVFMTLLYLFIRRGRSANTKPTETVPR
jgi:hypothetical protein